MINLAKLIVTAYLITIPLFLSGSDHIPTLDICIDYHCDFTKSVHLEAHEWQKITKLFAGKKQTAEMERDIIKSAIANFETIVGTKSGTWKDMAKNSGEGSVLGQLDCISESKNTTLYLNLLSQQGLIRQHQVKPRERRNPWFFDTHWTAVIKDRNSDQSYAVDSWFLKNGEPPIILPLETWRSGWKPD
ncbi:MAG: hypothetical protein GY696_00325 [Gammaproteobacteria bacterium]|nr:hypothetical protein [Gammaproteobacteria bacterium]